MNHLIFIEIQTESASMAKEEKTEAIPGVIDRRDVPNRDTAFHLAVKLGDEAAAEMLMVAGADWTPLRWRSTVTENVHVTFDREANEALV
ncbi:hypothetical protein LINGRAHAP2_LOCUS2780 [Linum grandiflorum]